MFPHANSLIGSDFTPYSLMSTETVREVEREVRAANPSLDDRVEFDHRRYRQNLIVGGAARPFDEDSYAFVRIGESVVLRTVCLIPRCQMTAIDPDTGVSHGGEPLKTLITFR